MTVAEVMANLQAHGNESMKPMLMKHGIKEPFFAVKVEYLKVLQKKIKKDYQLAKDLFATGNADAQYFAGLIADDQAMTRADLENWAQTAESKNIVEYTVPWVTAGSKHALELALEWINRDNENIETMGWNTLSGLLALTPDDELDLSMVKALMVRIEKTIEQAKNRVRYTMNGFIIGVGSYVKPLTEDAKQTANRIGVVIVDMNGTQCRVPDAVAYIAKVDAKGNIGKKKKTVKC